MACAVSHVGGTIILYEVEPIQYNLLVRVLAGWFLSQQSVLACNLSRTQVKLFTRRQTQAFGAWTLLPFCKQQNKKAKSLDLKVHHSTWIIFKY